MTALNHDRRKKLEQQTDYNFSQMKLDERYKGYLGIVANLIAHTWPLIKRGDKYYLVYGYDLNSRVYDVLLYDKGTIYSDCLIEFDLTEQDLFI